MLLNLFSGSLFLLPILVTLGVYVGVENQKVIKVVQGKPPPGVNPDGTRRIIKDEQYCQKAYGIEPFPYRYIYNPNQWGDPDNTGALCLDITTDNTVSKTEQYAFNWTTTWTYPQGPQSAPVHAYPNALLNDTALPVQVSTLNNLTIDLQWNYAQTKAETALDINSLMAGNLNANAAVDMFLSDDKTKAENATEATHEVMIWLGRFGLSTIPLGFTWGEAPKDTVTIDNVQFGLYYGTNGVGQNVFTWLAADNTTSFKGDVTQLITRLSTIPGGPTGLSYLGYIAFGSEIFYAGQNMTFSVPKMAMAINGA